MHQVPLLSDCTHAGADISQISDISSLTHTVRPFNALSFSPWKPDASPGVVHVSPRGFQAPPDSLVRVYAVRGVVHVSPHGFQACGHRPLDSSDRVHAVRGRVVHGGHPSDLQNRHLHWEPQTRGFVSAMVQSVRVLGCLGFWAEVEDMSMNEGQECCTCNSHSQKATLRANLQLKCTRSNVLWFSACQRESACVLCSLECATKDAASTCVDQTESNQSH